MSGQRLTKIILGIMKKPSVPVPRKLCVVAHLMVCPYVCLVVLTTRRELEMESETTLDVNPINAFLSSFLSNPTKILSNSLK